VAKTRDAGEVIQKVCEAIAGEVGEAPLSHLVEGWLAEPEWDGTHPQVTPQLCESLGRCVAGVAASVIEQAIARAMAYVDQTGTAMDNLIGNLVILAVQEGLAEALDDRVNPLAGALGSLMEHPSE
jgi:hypothetical protein